MSLVLHNEQQRTAQLAYDNQHPDHSEIDLAEAANELLDNNDVLRGIAADELAFSLSGDWFTDATAALIKLEVKRPDDLLGSQLLADLYQLAKVARTAALEVARERVEHAA